MPDALVIRHVHVEDLGAFSASLETAGYEIRFHDAGFHTLDRREAAATDLLVILGGLA